VHSPAIGGAQAKYLHSVAAREVYGEGGGGSAGIWDGGEVKGTRGGGVHFDDRNQDRGCRA